MNANQGPQRDPWDDDDWVGEPPEGRHSRARARPDYWRGMRIPSWVGLFVLVALVILLIAWLS